MFKLSVVPSMPPVLPVLLCGGSTAVVPEYQLCALSMQYMPPVSVVVLLSGCSEYHAWLQSLVSTCFTG
jgi:hypothetical protein